MGMMMVTATSCDNKQAQGTDKNTAQDSLAPGVIVASDTVAPDSTTPDSATANLTEYVNAKYGYQVKVPAQMRCTDRPPMAEGANYALGGDDVMNMMSLFCSENYGGKAFTPSEKESELKELASQLAQDAGVKVEQQTDEQGWTITVSGGEMFHQVYRTIYKGSRRYELTYIYSEQQEQTLGGNTEQEVIASLTTK